jgi:hypothetical protein
MVHGLIQAFYKRFGFQTRCVPALVPFFPSVKKGRYPGLKKDIQVGGVDAHIFGALKQGKIRSLPFP